MPVIRRRHAEVPKRATNVSVSEPLLQEAKALKLNLSQAAEAGIAKAVADKRGELWLEENAATIQSYNEFVEKHGMVLDEFRMF